MNEEFSKIKSDAMYEGYIWMSDSEIPKVYDNEKIDIDFSEIKNPFILEGQLLDKKNRISYSIKCVDNKYIVNTYDLKSILLKQDHIEIKSFIPCGMANVKKIRFVQLWKSETDDLCEKMQVLQPAEFVFVGFKK